MAAKKKAAKAATAAAAARNSPYVQRVIEDEDLRDNVRDALDAARDAYDRLSSAKAPHKAILEDKKLQQNLQDAAVSLRDAGQSLKDGPKKRKSGGLGKLLLVALVGAALAVGLSEGLRSKVLDTLFGKEEEFEYTSSTTPASPAPEPAGSSA